MALTRHEDALARRDHGREVITVGDLNTDLDINNVYLGTATVEGRRGFEVYGRRTGHARSDEQRRRAFTMYTFEPLGNNNYRTMLITWEYVDMPQHVRDLMIRQGAIAPIDQNPTQLPRENVRRAVFLILDARQAALREPKYKPIEGKSKEPKRRQ
ncbi:hypothetical protein MMC21_005757 [Puttea exsequens]|nr:hypothetical protein [Puttea exsequens]